MRDFDLPAVDVALAGTRFAGQVQHRRTTGSTSTLALEAAARGVRAGVWVADEQTAGRGRGGHTWHSAPGEGLYVSALVAPSLSAANALTLSLATGLAAQEAIQRATGLAADLRWPNDLMLNGRKCGGILVETAIEAARGEAPAWLRYAVIGIGINVGHRAFPAELAPLATSLRLEADREIPREPVLSALLYALDRELTEVEREAASGSFGGAGEARGGSVLDRFERHSSWVRGKRVTVDDRYTGTTAGLTPEGFLRVAADDGELHVVRSGGVREPHSGEPRTAVSAHTDKT